MVDFSLTDEQQMIQKTARDFAQNEIVPLAEAVRNRPEGTSPWDLVRPVYQKASELGLTKLLIPEEYGGMGGTCLDNVIVMEEFGAADLGIAASYFNVSMTAPIIIARGANEEQRRRWLPQITESNDHVLASASGEPNVAGADSFTPDPDPKIGLRTHARREGDHYVLNGTKAGFSTNAGAAKSYFIMARTNLNAPSFASTSMFYVPADTPGLKVGGKTHLIGWDTAMHAEVYLDDVRVPAENMIGEEGGNWGLFFMQTVPYLASGLAACYLGLARAAFETAFQYAQERKSWGKPIIEHQAVALKLADMVADLEAARLLVWKLAWGAERGDPHAAGILSPAAKTTAIDTAIANAERALKVLGSYGVAQDYPTGRYLNDAWIGDCCDGTRDMLRLGMVQFLKMQAGGPPPGMPAGGPPPGMEGPPPGMRPEAPVTA